MTARAAQRDRVRGDRSSVSWLDLDSLARQISIGRIVDELLVRGNSGESFHRVSVRCPESHVPELRDVFAVHHIGTGKRSANDDGGTRHENRPLCPSWNIRGGVHACAQFLRWREINLHEKTVARWVSGRDDLRYGSLWVSAACAVDRDAQLHPFAHKCNRRLGNRGLQLQGPSAIDLKQWDAG